MMNNAANIQTVTFGGERFVILPEVEYRRLQGLPPADATGRRPAVAALRAVMARDIIRDREFVGWSQAELARRAGIRVETLNRIEAGSRSPSVATIEKIDAALRSAGKGQTSKKPHR